MIHTIEIRRKSSEYNAFMKLKNDPSLCHEYPGIKFIPEEIKIGDKGQSSIYKVNVKINLSRTTVPGDYLRIYQGQNPEEIIETINDAFADLELPPVQTWTLYQVHFTVDIYTPYVSEYLEILSHGNHKKRPEHREDGSLWIKHSPRTVTINFYSKEEEQRKNYGEEAAEQARGILRLEVQCKDDKLRYLFSKYDLSRDLVSMLLADDGCYIFDMVSQTVGDELWKILAKNDCDYIKKDAAIAKVEASRGRRQRKTHTDLLHLIHLVNHKDGTIRTASNYWKRERIGSTTAFKDRLKDLYSIGVHPICLPSDSPLERLTSLCTLYLNAFAEECKTAIQNRENLQ